MTERMIWERFEASRKKGAPERSPIYVQGMFGIGDNLHQRAIIRELMKENEVWIKSCHFSLYHDLVAKGLKVVFQPTSLRAQARTIVRERSQFHPATYPKEVNWKRIWYNKPDIDLNGTILASMFAEFNMKPEWPDFSLPIHQDWRPKAEELLRGWRPDKPVMIYRPIVRRKEWNGETRNPLPEVYKAVYRAIKEQFFAISIADLQANQEWIVGEEQPADVKIHDGSMDFPTLAALFSMVDLVVSPAGFAPILAQATGTPSIVVYGGRESFKSTDIAGVHLAPTLGIDPDNPCDCHSSTHQCNKTTDVPRAVAKARGFALRFSTAKPRFPVLAAAKETSRVLLVKAKEMIVPSQPPRVLIFATTYVEDEDRMELTRLWVRMHSNLNPECDILLVDSQSPKMKLGAIERFTTYQLGKTAKRMYYNFPDNVGHLSRKGRDGWGRAFCFGLDAAVDGRYDYVVHIEGDSLFRKPLKPIIQDMMVRRTKVLSVPVRGMRYEQASWVETGLMLFDVGYLIESNFAEQYNWKIRTVRPTPEIVVRAMLGADLTMAPWKALRGDKSQIDHQNILDLGLDWVTHCHNDKWVYERYAEAYGGVPREQKVTERLKLNLGCGSNKLEGWENYDADVDITKSLPWPADSAQFILIEHCVEHVSYHEAVGFFEEAMRVLVPGGTLRVTVPSLEQVAKNGTQEYYQFVSKWGGEATKKGAMKALIFAHGHKQAWTESLMRCTLEYVGFIGVLPRSQGGSDIKELRGVEGHWRVIGTRFDRIESMAFEATKPGITKATETKRVAIVLGGGESVDSDYTEAIKLCAEAESDPIVFYINDQIPRFDGPGVAVSLHPEKLEVWLNERKEKALPSPDQVWAHSKGAPRANGQVTDHTDDWAGSSGLFAVKVALELGYRKIILCGVPMDPVQKHFIRHAYWNAVHPFRPAWERNHQKIAPYVRSFSGWTAQRLGRPSVEFLRS